MLAHLVRVSLEGAVLAAGVWLVCRALPRMSPGVRAFLWWCVAAKFVVALVWLTPIGVPVLPRAAAVIDRPVETSAPPAPATSAPGMSAPATLSQATTEAAGGETRSADPPASAPPSSPFPWAALLAGAWALGLAVSLLRTSRDWRRTQAMVARSVPADQALRGVLRELSGRLATPRTVDVRVSAEVESPVIVGVRKPVILVPAHGFATLSPEQQRMALCHELAHLRRGDLWLGCVPAAAERCFFFHPLARLAAREYAFWREAACDEAVLSTLGASPQSYGRMLLALGVSRRTAAFSAAGAAWSFQNLKRRIIMLDRTASSSLRGRALAAGAVAAALLAIAPVRAVARSVAAPAPAPVEIATPGDPTPSTAPVSAAAPMTSPAPQHAAAESEAAQEELHFVLFREGEDGSISISGSTEDRERAERHRRSGEAMLWFRYEGREYVVRDRAVLDEVDELWEPVGRIGEEQGEIGGKMGEIGEAQGRVGVQQGEIGERQGRLGERMASIGLRQAALASRQMDGRMSDSERRAMERERAALDAESRRLEEEMEAMSEEMDALDAPMRSREGEMDTLSREMEVLGGRMEAALESANRGMVRLVRRAIESGVAVSVR